MLRKFVAALGLMAACVSPAAAQETARITLTTFHSAAVAGNLEGNEADRAVYVITPPGYDENPQARYPVVYFLHGYWATPQMYQEMVHFEEAVQQSAAAGQPFIMVMPDGHSRLKGGFYSSGPTVGDYETMVTRDLVGWVDSQYQTLARPESRGLAGHSMGGYGTIRIAMKQPGVFSSIYMMSACCLPPMAMTPEDARRIEAITPEEVAAANFAQLASISTLAAWSPDPAGGFLHVDTGLRDDGTIDPLVGQRLAANSPLVLLPQYLPALNALEAFAMDIGDADFLLEGNAQFRAELDRFGVAYQFELYEGDHVNRIGERVRTEVLPFFAAHLVRE